jgi:EAL domain-containing protein (putative c-di-GMP-specific phosphodiesterase class I)/putative methionine-R-sulfoxide reductase with GAF domain
MGGDAPTNTSGVAPEPEPAPVSARVADPLETLAALLREFSDPLSVMRRITDEVLALITAAEGAAVELVDGDSLRCVCGAGTLQEMVGTRVSVEASLSGLAVDQGTTLLCHDARQDPRIDQAAAAGVRAVSVVVVPLRCTDRLVGALNVAATRPNVFDERDVATLAGLSSFMTAVLTAAADLTGAADQLMSAAGNHDGADTAGMTGFVANVLRPGALTDVRAAQRVEHVLTQRQFVMVYQPIVDVRTGRVEMVEALTRFTPQPVRPPDAWFADAWRTGFGPELELAAVEAAMADVNGVPASARMAVNLNPHLVDHPALGAALEASGPQRIVLELTEHVAVEDYPMVRQAIGSLRDIGVQLAIDDTGSGFASLSHILKLDPDIIKLDRELISGIDHDPVRQSLATAIVHFSADIGADVVAEAVETADELSAVRDLGIRLAQGFLLARPGALGEVTAELDLERLAYGWGVAPASSA